MSEIEPRVRAALRGLPGPGRAVTEDARRAALAALPGRRPRRILSMALAAAAAAALVAGVALGATDRLDVRIGSPPATAERPALQRAGELTLPEDVRGMAIVRGGRLWLATRNGLRASGLAVSTAELSPNARYAAVGIGDSLVALAPDRTAWSHPAGGRVVAAAWAPNPILIAYVVRAGDRHELRMIEGDGDNDRLVDSDVAPARPTWRADTGALAYAGADGRLRILDRVTGRIAAGPTGAAPIAALAYSSAGRTLAVISGRRADTLVVLAPDPQFAIPLPADARLAGLTWRGDELIVGLNARGPGGDGRLWTLRPGAGGAGLKPLLSDPLPSIAAAAATARGVAILAGDRQAIRALWRTGRLEAGPGGAGAPPRSALRLPGPGATEGSVSVR